MKQKKIIINFQKEKGKYFDTFNHPCSEKYSNRDT